MLIAFDCDSMQFFDVTPLGVDFMNQLTNETTERLKEYREEVESKRVKVELTQRSDDLEDYYEACRLFDIREWPLLATFWEWVNENPDMQLLGVRYNCSLYII